jgi:hypothetical protein
MEVNEFEIEEVMGSRPDDDRAVGGARHADRAAALARGGRFGAAQAFSEGFTPLVGVSAILALVRAVVGTGYQAGAK